MVKGLLLRHDDAIGTVKKTQGATSMRSDCQPIQTIGEYHLTIGEQSPSKTN